MSKYINVKQFSRVFAAPLTIDVREDIAVAQVINLVGALKKQGTKEAQELLLTKLAELLKQEQGANG